MQNILLYTALITYFFFTSLTYGASIRTQMIKKEYTRAIESGADAAAKHTKYKTQEDLENLSFGYGVGYENTNNLRIDKMESLQWFYRIFFKNIGIEYSVEAQNRLKQYIPMKAIVSFDRLYIADKNDNWVVETPYKIDYKGEVYLFTLSDQIYRYSTNSWIRQKDLGIDAETRKTLVSRFIQQNVQNYINASPDKASSNVYTFNLGLNDYEPEVNAINGTNFIVFVEGMPIPGLNVFYPNQKLYAFSIGGTELIRK